LGCRCTPYFDYFFEKTTIFALSLKNNQRMTHLKTSFAIALLACFLTVKTNAQVGVTMKHVKKSVVFKQQNNTFKPKPHPLNIPKLSYAQNPYYRWQAEQNALFGTNNIEAIFSRNSSVLEKVVGGILLFTQ
jgi:hypothetical protein